MCGLNARSLKLTWKFIEIFVSVKRFQFDLNLNNGFCLLKASNTSNMFDCARRTVPSQANSIAKWIENWENLSYLYNAHKRRDPCKMTVDGWDFWYGSASHQFDTRKQTTKQKIKINRIFYAVCFHTLQTTYTGDCVRPFMCLPHIGEPVLHMWHRIMIYLKLYDFLMHIRYVQQITLTELKVNKKVNKRIRRMAHRWRPQCGYFWCTQNAVGARNRQMHTIIVFTFWHVPCKCIMMHHNWMTIVHGAPINAPNDGVEHWLVLWKVNFQSIGHRKIGANLSIYRPC